MKVLSFYEGEVQREASTLPQWLVQSDVVSQRQVMPNSTFGLSAESSSQGYRYKVGNSGVTVTCKALRSS